MKRILVGLITTACVALTACGSNPPSSGIIQNKRYTAPYTDSYMMPEHFGSITIYHEVTDSYPADWSFQLRDCQSDGQSGTKCKIGWRDVDETTYHQYSIGQQYP